MSLKSVLKKIAGVAPLLTKMLPIPGAGIAGDLIASALGVENTPAAIEAALLKDKDALLKIKAIETEHQTTLSRLLIECEAKTVGDINRTMRAEGKSEHWIQFSWRPFWGFVSAVAFLIAVSFTSYIFYQAIFDKNTEALTMLPQLVTAYTMLFSVPMAILGIASWHRGKEKRFSAGEGFDPTGRLLSPLVNTTVKR